MRVKHMEVDGSYIQFDFNDSRRMVFKTSLGSFKQVTLYGMLGDELASYKNGTFTRTSLMTNQDEFAKYWLEALEYLVDFKLTTEKFKVALRLRGTRSIAESLKS